MTLIGTGLILAMMLCFGSTFRVAENVVFEKIQEISSVRSKWMFSFFTDLQAYERYMERLGDNLDNTERNIDVVLQKCRNLNNLHFLPMYEGQKREVASLKEMYAVAKQDLEDIVMIQESRRTKVKRAVLPIVGKALSWLFGTLTKNDLRKVYKQIDLLGDNQEQIIHVLNDTISVLNVTTVQVKENRHAIRTMTNELRNLNTRLFQQSNALRQHMRDLQEFLLTYLQLDLMLTEVREAIEKGMFYMENIKMQMDQLTLGHIAPTVIQPGELKRILKQIRAQIPDYLTLPAPEDDIWYYYKTLTCVTLVKDGRFITLVNLPLLDSSSQFEVFQIHNIPLPFPRKETKMSARYELETQSLAVNIKQTEYILLTDADMIRCSNPAAKFCMHSSPIYKLSDSQLCVIALYKRDKTLVDRDCKTKVQFGTIFPTGLYIPDGNWVVVSQEKILFTVMCLHDQTYQVQTQPPVFNLKLELACEAFADRITLPPYYHKSSQYGSVQQRDALLTLRDSSQFKLWQSMDTILNNTDLTTDLDLQDLDEIQDMHIDDLVDRLNRLKKPESLTGKTFWDYVEYAVFPLIIMCVLLTLIILLWSKKKSKFCGAMAKIMRAGTTLKAGINDDVENVDESSESAADQPRSGHRRPGIQLELREMDKQ